MIAARRSDRVVLDSHVWLAYARGTGISPKVVRRVDAARSAATLFVAAITLWELAMLASQGRLKLSGPTLGWIADAVRATGVVVHPLEPIIAVDSAELPLFHGDPADRMIVSTARHLGALLITKDAKIHNWAAETKAVRAVDP